MECDWQSYQNILPPPLRWEVEKHKSSLLETRLRRNVPVEIVTRNGSFFSRKCATVSDLNYCINAATKYSPWTAQTMEYGYITAPGGHRIGLCGETVWKNGILSSITNPTSLCIRVARDFPGIGKQFQNITGSIIIIGPPGSGKTTLLRDIIRQKSALNMGCIGVVDERKEIFPLSNQELCFFPGNHTDILSGCRKQEGVEMLIRCMTPQWVAMDEITSQKDADSLMHACWCGVQLICTAHANSVADLMSRPVYRSFIKQKVFDWLIVLQRDKSSRIERMRTCS